MINLTLPIATVSEANSREYWRKKAARAATQRAATNLAIRGEIFRRKLTLPMPLRVTFTRLGVRELDSDNLQGAFKAIRDGLADAIGVNDKDKGYTWVYLQEKAKQKAVRITIERAA